MILWDLSENYKKVPWILVYLNESCRNPVSELKFIKFEKMAPGGTEKSQNLALFCI